MDTRASRVATAEATREAKEAMAVAREVTVEDHRADMMAATREAMVEATKEEATAEETRAAKEATSGVTRAVRVVMAAAVAARDTRAAQVVPVAREDTTEDVLNVSSSCLIRLPSRLRHAS